MTDKEVIKRLEKENKNLREAMHKDFCSHYVLGECSQEHHNNCVGRNQCIKELEAENERLKKDVKFYNSQLSMRVVKLQKINTTLAEIKEIANNIVYSDDMPSCVNDADCPLNGRLGYDNHCNTKCPFILGKHILEKISEVGNV